MFVQTVPQVSSYLITGEADIGFINLTNALAIEDRIGGYILVDDKEYSDIMISLGVIKKDDIEANEFLEFLKNDKVSSYTNKIRNKTVLICLGIYLSQKFLPRFF